ncbi:MAG: hypothetical protein JNM66_09325 [Bryobacterales bacterium]|nr:hypothetical protein [Bryobacterales bacterium]
MAQRRLWRLRSLGGRYVLLRREDLAPAEVPLAPEAGWQLVERILASPQVGSDLETIAAAMAGRQARLNRSAVRQAILGGSFVLLAASSGPPNSPGAPQPAESPADQILKARVVKTWVEMELVDAAGAPVAGQRFLCVLPDGDVREGQLNANGRVRFDDIDPGNCVFTFPDLDRADWRPRQ